MGLRGALAVVAGLVLVASGCTTPTADGGALSPDLPTSSEAPDEPAAEPEGTRVAVIVGPSGLVPSGEAAALSLAADGLDGLEEVTDVRVVAARTLAFVQPLGTLLADEGYDVVCVVGTGTAEVLVRLATRRPGTRFCGTDVPSSTVPDNVAVVALDLVAVVGLAGVAIGPVNRPVLLLLPPDAVVAEAATAALDAGLPAQPAPVEPSPAPSASPSPVTPDRRVVAVTVPTAVDAATTVVEALLDDDPSAIVALSARHDAAVVAAAAGRDVSVLGLADWLVTAEGSPRRQGVLVQFAVDRGLLLREAVRAALGSGRGAVTLLPPAAGAAAPVAGRRPGADAALARAFAALEAAQEQPDAG